MTYFVYPRRQLWYGSEPGTMKSTLRFPALYLMLLYWAGSYSRHWGHSCDARWEACLLWGNKYMCVYVHLFLVSSDLDQENIILYVTVSTRNSNLRGPYQKKQQHNLRPIDKLTFSTITNYISNCIHMNQREWRPFYKMVNLVWLKKPSSPFS